MIFEFGNLNWLAIGIAFVVGQGYLTLWFTVLFGDKWALAYRPNKTKAEHTAEIPPYTYAFGAVCMILLVLGIALLQSSFNVSDLSSAFSLAGFLSLFIVLATMLPAYAFLKRWNAFVLAIGSQVSLIFILSAILISI